MRRLLGSNVRRDHPHRGGRCRHGRCSSGARPTCSSVFSMSLPCIFLRFSAISALSCSSASVSGSPSALKNMVQRLPSVRPVRERRTSSRSRSRMASCKPHLFAVLQERSGDLAVASHGSFHLPRHSALCRRNASARRRGITQQAHRTAARPGDGDAGRGGENLLLVLKELVPLHLELQLREQAGTQT
jgi:hypothetical protein